MKDGREQAHAAWAHCANLMMGGWLIAAAFTLDYVGVQEIGSGLARLTEQRELPSNEWRGAALFWSDLASGGLLLLCSAWSVLRPNVWSPWLASAVGMWLIFAPLVLWAPTAGVYANDTLVGALAIAFALLIPGVPGLPVHPGPEVPPGWNYNPSSWLQRAPIIAFALLGFFISRYLSAYQLGHLSDVWDPFFPEGTRAILDSDVSLAWPVSDAGLGAVSYLLEALTGLLGDRRRWRTMPWMVIVFVILVVPLGVVSVVLVILQPVAVGAWCTLCLVTAAAMLVMISPALDEVIATCQFLVAARRAGQPVWRTFFLGGALPSDGKQAQPSLDRTPATEVVSAVGLTSVPWNLVLSAALGVWLMAAPAVLDYAGAAAASDQICGALVVTFAVIAIGEVSRAVRWINIPIALWLCIAPWLLPGGTMAATVSATIVGIALIGLSVPRGHVTERFGSWDRWVF